jgi:hypothetical protein
MTKAHRKAAFVEFHFEFHRARKIGKRRQTDENAGNRW